MTLNPARREAEVHVQLCTDKTIHYPEMHKVKTISDADYAAWKATLTRDELLGNYVRVPTSTVFAKFTHDETALLDSAPDKFQTIMQGRVNDSAENAMRHSIPSQHKTTKQAVKI
ncbi:MAG TPA: hypothetical protein VM554_16210 [Acidisarcina sp.]|nr:hypothetical protein [Acidisarcina sp.]